MTTSQGPPRSKMLRNNGVACGAALLTAWLACAAAARAQTVEAIAPALHRALGTLERAGNERVRFTYLDRNHTLNYNDKGKRTADFTRVYDLTYIAGLEYARLVEMDGKPLAGRALREEQDRYDAAVRERSVLDAGARARLEHHLQQDAGIDLQAIDAEPHPAVLGRETLDGREYVVVETSPGGTGGNRRYRLWLDPARDQIARLDFEQIGDEGEMLRGSQGTKRWIYLDGAALVAGSAVDATYLLHRRERIRVVVEHTCSNFRRFSATATMVPAPPQ